MQRQLSTEELQDMKRLFDHYMPLGIGTLARAMSQEQSTAISTLGSDLSRMCTGYPPVVIIAALLTLCHLYFRDFAALQSPLASRRVM
jgi:hypothetical protein